MKKTYIVFLRVDTHHKYHDKTGIYRLVNYSDTFNSWEKSGKNTLKMTE